jgi:hypothetical protein
MLMVIVYKSWKENKDKESTESVDGSDKETFVKTIDFFSNEKCCQLQRENGK